MQEFDYYMEQCHNVISTLKWVVHKSENENYTVSQNVPPLACYNMIIFGRNVTEKVSN